MSRHEIPTTKNVHTIFPIALSRSRRPTKQHCIWLSVFSPFSILFNENKYSDRNMCVGHGSSSIRERARFLYSSSFLLVYLVPGDICCVFPPADGAEEGVLGDKRALHKIRLEQFGRSSHSEAAYAIDAMCTPRRERNCSLRTTPLRSFPASMRANKS